jgi:drug/metabolite transporter (DMT)-like permease
MFNLEEKIVKLNLYISFIVRILTRSFLELLVRILYGKKVPTLKAHRMTQHHSFFYGSLFMLLSSVFLAFGYLVAKTTALDLPFFYLVFARYFIGLLLVILFFAANGKLVTSVKTKKLKMHFLRGFIVTFSQSLLFIYLTYGSLLNASLFMNLAPLYIPLIERVVFKRSIGTSTTVSMIISSIGVLFILKPGSDLFQVISFIGLASGFLWAVSQVLYGQNVKHEKREVNVFYLFLTCTLFSAPMLLFSSGSFMEIVKQETFLPLFLFALALVTTLSQYYRGFAYYYYPISALSPFLYLSVLLSGFFDWAFFDHIPSTLTVIGGFLIVLGGTLKVVLRNHILKKSL